MRGGARIGAGRHADPDAVRRDKNPLEFVHLPRAGRTADAPAWPLSPAATRREKVMWAGEWRRPQAVAWEAAGLHVEVAIYVRTLRMAEKPGTSSALLAELRRQRDALGLTASGMKSLRWVISSAPDQVDASTPELEATGTESTPIAARSRWKVHDGGR